MLLLVYFFHTWVCKKALRALGGLALKRTRWTKYKGRRPYSSPSHHVGFNKYVVVCWQFLIIDGRARLDWPVLRILKQRCSVQPPK